MDFRPLLQKLIEIEMSVGIESTASTRSRIQDAEDYLLQMQSENISSRKKNVGQAEPQELPCCAILCRGKHKESSESCRPPSSILGPA